jgi:hypothetical protein
VSQITTPRLSSHVGGTTPTTAIGAPTSLFDPQGATVAVHAPVATAG